MTSMAVSPALTELRHRQQLQPGFAEETTSAKPSLPMEKEVELNEVPCCADSYDGLHAYLEVMEDQGRMADAFTRFAEALVPCLARIAVERPLVMTQNFDLRNDGGQLRVIDSDMSVDDIAWLESRLNADPQASRLAAEFNESVVGAYGDTQHPYYAVEDGSRGWLEEAIPGLADTVDRDVKFMSLLRAVRDADCGGGIQGDYYREHRYELAATKVKDFIMSPDTYRKTPAQRGGLTAPQKACIGEWKA